MAIAGGHNPGAAYPFPDLFGMVLMVLAGVLGPSLGLLVYGLVVRRWRNRTKTYMLFMLIVPALFGACAGAIAQHQRNMEREKREAAYAEQQEAYQRDAQALIRDPEIVLREQWYRPGAAPTSYARQSAREMVVKHSFDPRYLEVNYTAEQLRRLHDEAEDLRIWLVAHPHCPPDLVKETYPKVVASGQRALTDRVKRNMEAVELSPDGVDQKPEGEPR